MTPGPAAFVIIARFGPLGSFSLASASEQEKRSPISSTRTTPDLRNRASYRASSSGRIPTWDSTALILSLYLAGFSKIIGPFSEKDLAALINLWGLRKDSTYIKIV